jgi:hypothetical protein
MSLQIVRFTALRSQAAAAEASIEMLFTAVEGV